MFSTPEPFSLNIYVQAVPWSYREDSVIMERISKAALIGARDRLGLGSYASVKDIKAAFRRLAKDCHPDRAEDEAKAEKQMKQLNRAYGILLVYCEQYPIPLDEQSLTAHSPEGLFEDYTDRFYGDWFER